MATFGRKGAGADAPQPIGRQQASLPVLTKFNVTPHPLKMLLGIALFGVGAMVMFEKLLDPRGLLINGFIELGPTGADIFFIILIVLCLGMTAFACVGLVRSFGDKVFVTLDNQSITGPSSYNGTRTVRIAFNAVRDVNVTKMRDKEFLVIRSADGRLIKVGQANFRVATEWSQFISELNGRLGGFR